MSVARGDEEQGSRDADADADGHGERRRGGGGGGGKRYKNLVSNYFLGAANNNDDSLDIKQHNVWQERRLRLLNRTCCPIKSNPPYPDHEQQQQQQPQSPSQQLSQRSHDKNRSGRVLRSCDCETMMMMGTTNLFQLANRSKHADITPITTTITTRRDAKSPDVIDNAGSGGGDDTTDAIATKDNILKLIHEFLERREAKRKFGLGLVGKFLERKFKKNLNQGEGQLIYSFNDYRPYFTYWVTTVQIIVLLAAISIYGFGPVGFSTTLIRDNIYVSSLSWQWTAYLERDNLWIGPRAADLVHLGAKFTPCMRRDRLAYDVINRDRDEERTTGCCLRNDQSGCLQTQKEGCSYLNSKWHSWNEMNSNVPNLANGKKRTSGPVCGQDPAYCRRPASIKPHEWNDDISKWPICHDKIDSDQPNHHMSCELVGRPCCVGIHGQCRIITSQHCAFLRGTFHPEATLCSQVSCMEDVCGMVPFYARDYPDQWYRMFTALFLHAGLIHLAITVCLQYIIMRDIERLTGPSRMAIIYLLSGIAGYLASASFVPYHTQVGPSGSQFALLASLMVEVINSWELLETPIKALMKLVVIAVTLLILGLLPWFDNYAHIFGFITGFLLSLALIPYLTLNEYSRRIKVIQIWVCIILVVILFIVLTLPLYVFPLYECSWCKYLDCLPIYPDLCAEQDIKVDRIDVL